jgi:hypothetical protein
MGAPPFDIIILRWTIITVTRGMRCSRDFSQPCQQRKSCRGGGGRRF